MDALEDFIFIRTWVLADGACHKFLTKPKKERLKSCKGISYQMVAFCSRTRCIFHLGFPIPGLRLVGIIGIVGINVIKLGGIWIGIIVPYCLLNCVLNKFYIPTAVTFGRNIHS